MPYLRDTKVLGAVGLTGFLAGLATASLRSRRTVVAHALPDEHSANGQSPRKPKGAGAKKKKQKKSGKGS